MASSTPLSHLFLMLLIFFFSLTIITPSTTAEEETVYDMLPKFGLPKGLLPNCVTSYTFTPEDGNFEVNLEHSCYIKFDYLVYYDKKITGTIKMGSISNLKGIQVKSFLIWFDVDEIKVDLPPSDSIYFQVGIINRRLSVDQFENIRDCSKKGLASLSSSSSASPRSWSFIFELPPPVDNNIPMLLTE